MAAADSIAVWTDWEKLLVDDMDQIDQDSLVFLAQNPSHVCFSKDVYLGCWNIKTGLNRELVTPSLKQLVVLS